MHRRTPPSSADLVRSLVVLGMAFVVTACAGAPAVSGAAAGPAPRAAATESGAVGDVARLASADFVERSRAADRLVAAGEASLPGLGAAGEGRVAVPGGAFVSTTRPVLRSILEDLPRERVRVALQSPWPVVRREAAEELGRRGGWSDVPRLLEGLDDADPEVRSASAASVRRLTNRFFGYDARAAAPGRARAAGRWREWWSVEGRLEGGRDGPGLESRAAGTFAR